jgi:mRNA interferase RelE/StbE
LTAYKLKFERKAEKAFAKLGEPIKTQFKEKLKKVLQNPHIEANKLHGSLSGCYKIKLRQSGYRLVYKVEDQELIVLVLAVGKRDRKDAYLKATKMLNP